MSSFFYTPTFIIEPKKEVTVFRLLPYVFFIFNMLLLRYYFESNLAVTSWSKVWTTVHLTSIGFGELNSTCFFGEIEKDDLLSFPLNSSVFLRFTHWGGISSHHLGGGERVEGEPIICFHSGFLVYGKGL